MPRLTEQEQQEIVRYIEADKPLPEKYRFLLFEDKREVELVWNGKTSEVCNIQVIEQVDEPRAEKDCARLYFCPKTPTQYCAEGICSQTTLSNWRKHINLGNV